MSNLTLLQRDAMLFENEASDKNKKPKSLDCKNQKRSFQNFAAVLGSTAMALVLSNSLAFSDTGINAPAYVLSGGSSEAIENKTFTAESTTNNTRAYGILVHGNSELAASDITINTTGRRAHGVQVGAKGSNADGNDASVITLGENITITTVGSDSFGLHAIDGGTINGAATISTSNTNGFGVFAESYSTINLTGGEIHTTGNRGYGLVANNDIAKNNIDDDALGGIINAADVSIVTDFDRTFGAYASHGATITLDGGSILTKGERSYGILVSTDAVVYSSADIVTQGKNAHGVQAGAGASERNGHLILTGGSVTTEHEEFSVGLHAVFGGEIEGTTRVTTSGVASYGIFAESNSTISLHNSSITTHGDYAAGALANNDLAQTGGVIHLTDTSIITNGREAHGVLVAVNSQMSLLRNVVITRGEDSAVGAVGYGGELNITDSVLTSEQSVGLVVLDSADVRVDGSRLEAAEESIVSNIENAGQVQTITVGAGSEIIKNNGTLLKVLRGQDGGDGVVTLTLEAGSTTQGDILDLDSRTTGGTDVYLNEGASWSGSISGVRGYYAAAGSDSTFEGDVKFEETFVADGNGASFTFNGAATFEDGFSATNENSIQFSTIPGVETVIETNLELDGGSQVLGGTIATPVLVKGDAVVLNSSVFNGNFVVLGHVTNEGATGPGNSIGSHTYGSVTWGPDHVYNVEVDGTGASDLVTVTGTANIAGSVKLTPLGGYLVGTPYTILKAGNIEGRFNDKVDFIAPTVFLTANLKQGPTDVQLSIDRSDVTFASVTKTENQAAIAGALDKAALGNKIVSAITFSSVEGAVNAFDQLSGEVHASTKAGLIETASLVQNTINNRLRGAFDGVASSESQLLGYAAGGKTVKQDHGVTVWGSGFGSWGHFNGTANVASTKTSSGGFVAGIDGALNEAWRLGVTAGYSRTSLSTSGRSSSAKSDNYHLGVYAGAEWGNLGFRTGLNYTWHKVSSNRSVSFAGITDSLSGSYSGGTFQAFGEMGYKVEVEKARFEPFANLSYASARTDSFTETGNATALSVSGNTTSVTFLTLGARAETKLDFAANGAKLHGMLGWRHAFGNVVPSSTNSLAGANAFSVSGMPIARNSAVVEAGMDFNLSQQALIGVSYTGQFGSGAHQNGFNARFSAKF